jgi:hypothetical protein
MVRDQRSARPAQRKGSIKTTRTTKKSLSASAPRSEMIAMKPERPAKPLPPKIVGELPVPIATFFL